MADITFGVKVPEEMKEELNELMKSTQLTGKEFMGLLLSSYKLEKNKEVKQLFHSDVEELQRLLQRIQNLYVNVNERASIYMEEQEGVLQEALEKVKEQECIYKEEVQSLKETLQNKEVKVKEKNKEIEALKEVIKGLKEDQEDYQLRVKQSTLLNEQYEANIDNLKKRIEVLERFEVEVSERQEENQKLQTRNDELASEVWFLQREKEKLDLENQRVLTSKEDALLKMKESYELELKNSLLEQKLSFTQKIELLKESYYEKQEVQNKYIQDFLLNKKQTETSEKDEAYQKTIKS